MSSLSYASLQPFLMSSQVTMDIIYLRTPLAFLLLPLVVLGAPTDEPSLTEPAPGACRRCCDPLDSSTDASPHPPSHRHLPYPMPEVRPYINITILKGKCPSWSPGCQGLRGASLFHPAVAGLARGKTFRKDLDVLDQLLPPEPLLWAKACSQLDPAPVIVALRFPWTGWADVLPSLPSLEIAAAHQSSQECPRADKGLD